MIIYEYLMSKCLNKNWQFINDTIIFVKRRFSFRRLATTKVQPHICRR